MAEWNVCNIVLDIHTRSTKEMNKQPGQMYALNKKPTLL